LPDNILLLDAGRAAPRLRLAMRTIVFPLAGLFAALALLPPPAVAADDQPLIQRLRESRFKIAYESYVNNNSDIFVMNADGSDPVNLTQTSDLNEHYPQVSPDGRRICYVADKGEGREAVRSLWVMNSDGTDKKKIADYAREPFWSPDGKVIGYLDQEFPKFNVIDYYTKGMEFYDVDTGTVTRHVNYDKLHHLYNPNFCANGKWIVSTVHAGMGYDHTILLIAAHGTNIINLKIPGCRPRFSPDGKQLGWGCSDHEIIAAPIDTDSDEPRVGPWRLHILDETNKIYHTRWSPDGKYISFSRGPDAEGDLTKPGTFEAACEIMGVYAGGWNIGVVPAEGTGTNDLNKATPEDLAMLTTNGLSNKESVWFVPPKN